MALRRCRCPAVPAAVRRDHRPGGTRGAPRAGRAAGSGAPDRCAAAPGPRPHPAAVVPGVERPGRVTEGPEHLDGVHQPGVVRAAQVLPGQLQAHLPRQPAGRIGVVPDAQGLARVRRRVDDRARQLRVEGPRAQVHVVRADGHPHVVDHAGLGVHVDRGPRGVLDPVDPHPVAAGGPQGIERRGPGAHGARIGDRRVRGRVGRQDDDQAQRGAAPQRIGEARDDLRVPHVLVLEVDEGLGSRQRLDVAVGDAALALGGEGEAGDLGREGAQDLHVVRAAGGDRIGQLGRERPGMQHIAVQHGVQAVDRVRGRGGGILPALAEVGLDVADRGTLHLDHEVVPGGRVAPDRAHRDLLRIAVVRGVVATRVAQVLAADEGHVALGTARMPGDDELLVVASHRRDPLVQHHLAAGAAHGVREVPVVALGVVQEVEMGAPEQAAHVDAPGRGRDQQRGDGGALGGQELVAVAAPVGEQEQVTCPHPLDHLHQAPEVRDPVDERRCGVAVREGRPVATVGQAREGVAALLGGQEPRLGSGPRSAVRTGAVRTSSARISAVRTAAGRGAAGRFGALRCRALRCRAVRGGAHGSILAPDMAARESPPRRAAPSHPRDTRVGAPPGALVGPAPAWCSPSAHSAGRSRLPPVEGPS